MTKISVHNGRLLYAVSALTGTWFIFSAFIFLFYESIGLTIEQFGILASISAISSIAMEVPSGVIADKWGRKKTLLLSGFTNILVPIVFFFGDNFWHMAIAAVLAGMLNAFRSGTKEAIIYDAFKQDKNEEGYQKYIGRFFSFEFFFAAVALIVGGFLATQNLRLLFLVSIASAIVIFILKLFLREPKVFTKRKESYFLHFKKTFTDFLKHKILLRLLYYVLVVSIIGVFWKYHQIYFDQVGLSFEVIGGIFAIMYLIAAVASYSTPYLTKLFGVRGMLYLIPITFGVIYTVMGIFPVYYMGFLVFIEAFVGGFADPFESNIRNKYIESSQRATMISINNFATRMQVIVVSLFIGYLAKYTTLTTVYVVLGLIVFIGGPIAAKRFIKIAKIPTKTK